jgi:hypothetical protein
MNEDPGFNDGQDREFEMKADQAAMQEFVFLENENYRQQTHACCDKHRREEDGTTRILQFRGALRVVRIDGKNGRPRGKKDDCGVDIPASYQAGQKTLVREEKVSKESHRKRQQLAMVSVEPAKPRKNSL